MQCAKEKANILFLPTLPYNKTKISKTIDIFKKLILRLNLDDNVFENKIVMVKNDWLIIQNII